MKKMFNIDGKIALISGGISGIGLHCAHELLKNGIKGVTLIDVNSTAAEEALRNIEKIFGLNKAIFFKTDVTKSDQIEAAFEKTVEKFGNIDIVINSAGLLDDAHWEKEVAVNVNGVINSITLGINKYLSKNQQGPEAVILNVSSTTGISPAYFYPIYSGSKSAIIGFTRAWGQDQIFQKTKVRVIAVCPGVTNTPMLANVPKNTLPGPLYQIEIDLPSTQEPAHLAKEVIEILKYAPNGTIWVVEEGEPAFQYIFPDMTTMKANHLLKTDID